MHSATCNRLGTLGTCLVFALLFSSAAPARAESFNKHFWVTMRGGYQAMSKEETSPSFAIGGGLIYGFEYTNFAVEADVMYSNREFGGRSAPVELDQIDVALGLQYRVPTFRSHSVVPFVGGGIDAFILNAKGDARVDDTYGGHVKAGVDILFSPYVIVTMEVRQTVTAKPGTAGVPFDYGLDALCGYVGLRVY